MFLFNALVKRHDDSGITVVMLQFNRQRADYVRETADLCKRIYLRRDKQDLHFVHTIAPLPITTG